MTDRENHPLLPSLLGDGLLLACALAGFTGSFLSLYGQAELGRVMSFRTTPLDQCAAWGGSFLFLSVAFALTALAAWSLPRFRGLAAGGLAGLLGLAALLGRERLLQGAGLTLRTVTLIFAQRVSWGRALQYDPGLTLAQEGAAARLFLLLALAVLALALGWAVVRARRWWMVLLLTLPPLLPGLLADLYPDWPAFMALAASWCAMLLTGLCRWAPPSARGRLNLAALAGAAAALWCVTLLFPREGYARPQWALTLEGELQTVTGRLSDFFSRFQGPFRETVTYVGAAGEADLAHAGPLNYTGRTVLRLTSDRGGRMYLRGSSLGEYRDGRWSALPDGAYREYLDRLEAAEHPSSPLLFPALRAEHGQAHTATIDNVGQVGACVYAPYFPAAQPWSELGILPVEDSYFARLQGQWTHTVAFVELDPALERGGAEPAAQQELNAYRAYVYAHYLTVPDELRGPLESFYRDHAGSSPLPLVCAARVADILGELCAYDLDAPAPPEGADPVLYFLNESRRGYCMHYASAATLLLRTLGIPARYVSGFAAEAVPGRTVNVPDRAAHAWVELWLDDFGWYPVEVTPAAALDWMQSTAADPFEPPSAPIEESREPEPSSPPPEPSQTAEPSQAPATALPADSDGDEAAGSAAARAELWKWPAAAAGLAALLWLGQFLPKAFRQLRLSGKNRNRTALYAYGCLRRMERWGGRVDPRALELAQKARFSQHTLTQEELDQLRGFVDRERDRLSYVLGPAARLAFRLVWGRPNAPGRRGLQRRGKKP